MARLQLPRRDALKAVTPGAYDWGVADYQLSAEQVEQAVAAFRQLIGHLEEYQSPQGSLSLFDDEERVEVTVVHPNRQLTVISR